MTHPFHELANRECVQHSDAEKVALAGIIALSVTGEFAQMTFEEIYERLLAEGNQIGKYPEPPAVWCCEGNGSGGHVENCRYSNPAFGPSPSPVPPAKR